MKVEQKARQLALTLVGNDQNPEPLIDALIEMAKWERDYTLKQLIKNAVSGEIITIHEPDMNQILTGDEYLDLMCPIPMDLKEGDKVKIIFLKK